MQDLQRNLYVLRRWWWLIVAAALLGGATAYLLTKALTHRQYEAASIVSMAPPPQPASGLYLTVLTASADSQLIPTLGTARAARSSLPPAQAAAIDASRLARSTSAAASTDGQLLVISVRWSDISGAVNLSNAVATTFIRQERRRLEARYRLLHHVLASKETFLTTQMRGASGGGAATNWLRSQYADAYSRVYQQDVDARAQASLQQSSLQMAQPADHNAVASVGPRATFNALLGAILGLLLGLVVAYVSTSSFDDSADASARQPVLTRVRD